jgi:cell division protein FtsX
MAALAEEEKQKHNIITYWTLAALALVTIIAVVSYRSLVQNRRANKIITEQKREVELKNNLIEEKQKEILDSIHYARRIQNVLITSEKYIHKALTRLNPQR